MTFLKVFSVLTKKMIQWYRKVVFENYANFSGRARRSEYWYFQLANFLLTMLMLVFAFLVGVVTQSVGGVLIFYILILLYSLLLFIPTLAVTVRRLHDVGKSGWYYFVGLIPIIGALWLLFLMVSDGDSGNNMYGDDPKNPEGEIAQMGIEVF